MLSASPKKRKSLIFLLPCLVEAALIMTSSLFAPSSPSRWTDKGHTCLDVFATSLVIGVTC